MAIAARWRHWFGLCKSNSTIVAWDATIYGQADGSWRLGTLVGISAGALHSLALETDGTLPHGAMTLMARQPKRKLGGIHFGAAGESKLASFASDTQCNTYTSASPQSQLLAPDRARATFFRVRRRSATLSTLSYQRLTGKGTNIPFATSFLTHTVHSPSCTDDGYLTCQMSNQSRGLVISTSRLRTCVVGESRWYQSRLCIYLCGRLRLTGALQCRRVTATTIYLSMVLPQGQDIEGTRLRNF